MNEPTLIQRIEAYLGDDNSPHITLSVSLVLLREALAALKEYRKQEQIVKYRIKDLVERDLER